MQKSRTLCVSFLVLIVYFLIPATTAYSQPASSSPDTHKELLSAFNLIENEPYLPGRLNCVISENETIEESLVKANLYNLEGNWKCCESILAQLSKKTTQYSPLQNVQLLLARADYLNSRQLYDSARSLLNLINQQARENEWFTERTNALLLLSYGTLKRRNISAAYLWADSALLLSRKENNRLLEGKALLQMAFCARRNFTSSTHRAFPYYLQAIDAAEAARDSATAFTSHLYFATDNFEINNWQEGMPHFKKAVAIATQSNNVNLAYSLCISVGYTLLIQGFSRQALVLYKRSLAIAEQQQLPYNIQHSYLRISGTLQEIKQYDTALLYANLAASVPGIDSFWSNIWELKAGIYNDMGNYKEAAAMYARSMAWANEDFLYRNQEQLSGYEAKLQTTEKELQIVHEKKRSQELQGLIVGAVILLVIAAWAYLVQRQAKQKLSMQNVVIGEQRAGLERSLSEKDLLLKEIHHRVKNNLAVISSLLELQSSGIQDEKAKAAITEGQNRVQSIALIHQRLYQHENLAAIEFSGFIQDMISQVSSVFKIPGQKIITDIVIPETLLDIDTAVPLGLVINELLTNSFKYAFTTTTGGMICMRLSSPKPGNYILLYSDNGPGMAENFDLKKSRSLGLRLIQRLSNQIGGSAVYSPAGCKFVITFKNSVTRNNEA